MQRDSRVIAAILAADVVDYSRLMGADEPGTLAALKARRAIFDEEVAEFGGREFGSVGDSLMAEFHSAVNAVSAALAIQARLDAANAALPQARRMTLRIGVTLGDVIEEKGGVFGDAVNLAARLQALAKPGGIIISGPVHEQVHHKVAARYLDAGTRHVKNIAEPVHAYEVLPTAPPGIAGRARGALAQLASRRFVRASAIAAAFVAVAGLGLFWREIPVPATGKRLGAVLAPPPAAPPANSLAVLPFINMTGDPANEYLGDGLAEELLHRLSRVPGLSVAARRSAFAYKGKDVDVRGIADALGVNYVVEGSVRRRGDVVRVNASLVDRAGANTWSDSYESSGDYFAIEDDIGTQVIAELQQVLRLRAQARPRQPRTGDVAAYDIYLRGLSHLGGPRNARTLDAAERLFLRSLEKDADFARAQAGLCRTRVERYFLERLPAHVAAAEEACARARALDDEAYEVHEAVGGLRLVTGDADQAEAAYRRALAIVPESPDALIGLATALADRNEVAEAERAFERAIAVQPRYPVSHMEYGNFLFQQGRARDATAPYQRAVSLDPGNPGAFNNLGVAYLYAGDFDKALDAFSRSLAIEPRRSSYSNAGTVLYYRGRYREAAEMFRKAIELAPADHRPWGNLADALRFATRADEALPAYRKALELAEAELAVNPRHAVNQAQAAYYAARLRRGDRARRGIEAALAEGGTDNTVHYYVALAELGMGDRSAAQAHARRARELGYPEVLMRAAPELSEIRPSL
jgi:TolB-like protein/class 3 adenylate cyclase/tetratricopeptide (TPR) repeat protein